MNKNNLYFERFIGIANEMSETPLDENSQILDFGCGAGDLVFKFRSEGFKETYGCDIKFKEGIHTSDLHSKGYIALVDMDHYKLPYPDNTFDLVVSHEVFEHVQDYDATFSEIQRVLKPGGHAIHKFPSKWCVIERHIYVPFAGVNKNKSWNLQWIYFWMAIFPSIRRKSQKESKTPLFELAKVNHKYMIESTNYLSRKQLVGFMKKYYSEYMFAERFYLKHTPQLRKLYSFTTIVPFIPFLVSSFWHRFIVLQK